ncbi:MAG: putative sulfate exporter family transporter, partial [Planctomycetes bacterium]|nr:putative sulfate exporter family transporter [Planctomycetota bacterium]
MPDTAELVRPSSRAAPDHRLGGLAALAGIVLLAKLAHWLAPQVPAVVYALGFGMLAGLEARRLRVRLALPHELPLMLGFVLMGAQVEHGVFAVAGLAGLALLAAWVAATLALFSLVWRLRLLPRRLAGLFALGQAGFGVSAVVAAGARDPALAGTPQTLATLLILLTGAAGLVAYPLLAPALGLDEARFAALAAVSIANNAEAIATAGTLGAGAALGAAALKVAINAFEGVALVAFLRGKDRPARTRRWHDAIPRVPGYVIGFSLVAALSLAGAFDGAERASLANLTHWAFFIALAGVGFRTRLDLLARVGWRPLAVGVAVWLLTAT